MHSYVFNFLHTDLTHREIQVCGHIFMSRASCRLSFWAQLAQKFFDTYNTLNCRLLIRSSIYLIDVVAKDNWQQQFLRCWENNTIRQYVRILLQQFCLFQVNEESEQRPTSAILRTDANTQVSQPQITSMLPLNYASLSSTTKRKSNRHYCHLLAMFNISLVVL